MKRERAIDADPTVRLVAAALKIRATGDLRTAITSAAVERVHGWLNDLGIDPPTLNDVHGVVLDRTGIRVERVETDEALETVAGRYQKSLRTLPKQLQFEFARETEAVVFQRQDADRRSSPFVAIVDARGERRLRAWFAERHEPAHVIIPDPSARVLWRRTQAERPEPIEQVVDAIASEVGFWEPIVRPVVEGCVRQHVHLVDALAAAREVLAPEASIEASYRAFVRYVTTPLLVVWSDYDCRAADRPPGGDPARSMALRVKTVIVNGAAERTGLRIWPNFRIPTDSAIASARLSGRDTVFSEQDNLARWPCETGRRLGFRPVRVTARGAWASIEADGA